MAVDEAEENRVLTLLMGRLSPMPRAAVARRYDAMVRELQ
jgi:hypothetical protein